MPCFVAESPDAATGRGSWVLSAWRNFWLESDIRAEVNGLVVAEGQRSAERERNFWKPPRSGREGGLPRDECAIECDPRAGARVYRTRRLRALQDAKKRSASALACFHAENTKKK